MSEQVGGGVNINDLMLVGLQQQIEGIWGLLRKRIRVSDGKLNEEFRRYRRYILYKYGIKDNSGGELEKKIEDSEENLRELLDKMKGDKEYGDYVRRVVYDTLKKMYVKFVSVCESREVGMENVEGNRFYIDIYKAFLNYISKDVLRQVVEKLKISDEKVELKSEKGEDKV